ncbi:MAG: nitroreductase [Armatimonadetes bacterium]|nr:nitroreductase [Armatimonadota bacterium]
MELKQALYGRRSVRAYSPEPVDRAVIAELIDAAIQAPSGMNRQPWAFGVVCDRQALADLDAKAKAHLLSILTDDSPMAGYRSRLEQDDFHLFYGAPALVVIYTKPNGVTANVDTCLAAQNLMLAAYERGLGSCWIGFSMFYLGTPAAAAELGIPEGYAPAASIILGRPATDVPPVPRETPEILFDR